MFNFKKLINLDYLFTINRVMLTRSDKVFLTLGIIGVALAVVLKIAARLAPTPADKRIRNRFYNLFLTIGLLEIAWYGARYEYIKFFGSHFVALLFLLIGLVWLIFIIADMAKRYRIERTEWEKEQVKLKYLPK